MRKIFLSVIFLIMPVSVLAWTTTNHFDTETNGGSWNIGRPDYGGIIGITGSQSTPGSPSNSLQITEPAGFPDSGVPGTANFLFPSPTKEFWMQYYFKYGSGFRFHNNANKQIYVLTTSSLDYLVINSNTFGNPKFGAIWNSPPGFVWSNTSYNPTISANQWYKVVFHAKIVSAGNDVFQLWINDGLVIDVQNTTLLAGGNYSSSFNMARIDPVWGGQGDTPITATQYQWYDSAIVSTDPILVGSGGGGAGGGTVKIPNPPITLEIR